MVAELGVAVYDIRNWPEQIPHALKLPGDRQGIGRGMFDLGSLGSSHSWNYAQLYAWAQVKIVLIID